MLFNYFNNNYSNLTIDPHFPKFILFLTNLINQIQLASSIFTF